VDGQRFLMEVLNEDASGSKPPISLILNRAGRKK
jgi:hypothetical protein